MENIVFVLILSYFAIVKVKPFTPKATIRVARIIAFVIAVTLFIIAKQDAFIATQYNAMGVGAIIVSILTPMFVIEIGPE
jgi:hypothetical protein